MDIHGTHVLLSPPNFMSFRFLAALCRFTMILVFMYCKINSFQVVMDFVANKIYILINFKTS